MLPILLWTLQKNWWKVTQMPGIKYLNTVTLVRDVTIILGIQKQMSQKHFSPWSCFIILTNPLKPRKCLCNKTRETYIMRASNLTWLQSLPYLRIMQGPHALSLQWSMVKKWTVNQERKWGYLLQEPTHHLPLWGKRNVPHNNIGKWMKSSLNPQRLMVSLLEKRL